MSHRLPNVHPGEILAEDFMEPQGISPGHLANATGLPVARLRAILLRRESVTPAVDAALSHYFGTSQGYWLRLQEGFDTAEISPRASK